VFVYAYKNIIYSRGRQIAAHRPNVARHSIFSGMRKHSGNIFNSEISSNLSQ